MNKPLFYMYQIIRSIRYTVLITVFGYVSHCPQTPTCGTYFLQMVKKKGIVIGSYEGFLRALKCSKKPRYVSKNLFL